MAKNRRFEDEGKIPTFGIRHLQCLLIFCGFAVAYTLRVNLSIAIVAMTDRNSTNTAITVYDWSEKTKSMLLSSFFWGYFIIQIPGGHFAHKFGGKVFFLQAVIVSSVLTVLTPLAARYGNWQLVCALRGIEGLVQGVIFPACHTIIAKWAPTDERGTLGTFCFTGIQFGTVVMLAVSGSLAASSYGWPSIFYVSGGTGLLWSIAYLIWGASSPRECKFISAEEKNYIETSLCQKEEKKHAPVPWMKILSSVPFYVLIVAQCTHVFGFIVLITQIPAYMRHILGLDIKSNALLSALPYLVTLLLGFVFSAMSQSLQTRKRCSLTTNRKIFNTVSTWIPMVSLALLGYVTADQINWAVFLLTITVGINAAAYVGWVVNHIDLSPNYAGILMGIASSCGNIISFIAPLVVGFVIEDEENPAQWRLVFFIASGIYFFGNLLFMIFGSAEIQPWNEAPVNSEELEYTKVKTNSTDEQLDSDK